MNGPIVSFKKICRLHLQENGQAESVGESSLYIFFHKTCSLKYCLVSLSSSDYKEYHTDTSVKFVIKMNKDKLQKAEETGLHKFFKLQTTMTQQTTMVSTRIFKFFLL